MSRRNILRVASWLILGFALGAGLGLFLGWVAWPLEISNADPSALEERYQEEYALMIAAAYAEDQDLATAQRRLSHLGHENSGQWLLGVAVDAILESRSRTDIETLANLAHDLGQSSPVVEPYLSPVGSEQIR